jgi:hypothetical protein
VGGVYRDRTGDIGVANTPATLEDMPYHGFECVRCGTKGQFPSTLYGDALEIAMAEFKEEHAYRCFTEEERKAGISMEELFAGRVERV